MKKVNQDFASQEFKQQLDSYAPYEIFREMDYDKIKDLYLDSDGFVTDIKTFSGLTPKPHNLFQLEYDQSLY